MLNKSIFIYFIVVPVLVFSLVGGCGGGSSDSSDPGVEDVQKVTIEGTVSDTVPPTDNQISLIERLENLIGFTLNAIAQDSGSITLDAFDQEDMLVAQTVVDQNGNFTIEVPCDTNLTLVFTSGNSSLELEGVNVPCPENGDDTILFITASLDFEDEELDAEFEQQQIADTAVFGCTEGEELMNLGEDDLEVDGMGGPCIITAGDCGFDLTAGSVSLVNCSACIDTRGTSSVIIKTTKFECIADNDGIRSVGNSTAQVLIAGAEMEENEMEMISLEEDDPDIEIIAGVGISAKGGSLVVLSTVVFQEEFTPTGSTGTGGGQPPTGEEPEEKPKCNNGLGNGPEGCTPGNAPPNDEGPQNRTFDPNGEINVQGTDLGIIAVGNSEVIVEGETCTISPEPGTETKGNAGIVIDCG